MSHPQQFCYLRPIRNLKFLSQKTIKGVTSNHSVTPPPPPPALFIGGLEILKNLGFPVKDFLGKILTASHYL